MKKIISFILIISMISVFALGTLAQSYNPSTNCDVTFVVKKTDPANVVKDGVIGEGEYEKIEVDLDPDETSLALLFGNAEVYDYAEGMLVGMEYYFSWDETNGLNVAVVSRPGLEPVMNLTEGTGDPPGDEFLCNGGLMVELDQVAERGELGSFYYAIGKNPSTGEYLEGHYNQLGITGEYDPVAGTDFAISFNDDGSTVYEWSLPFSLYTNETPEAGLGVYISIGCYSGLYGREGYTDADNPYNQCFGIGLGDFVFLGNHKTGTPTNAVGTLSDEMVPGNGLSKEDVLAMFKDLKDTWYMDGITYCVNKGLMKGMSEDEFSPGTSTTRGQVVTILYRLSGSPEITDKTKGDKFTDLKADWYKDAVYWAAEKGVVNGTSDTTFAPNMNITREQIAAMLTRYAGLIEGKDTSSSASIESFKDYKSVSAYAVDAFRYMYENEIITGIGENLEPKSPATRAQIATMLQRFAKS